MRRCGHLRDVIIWQDHTGAGFHMGGKDDLRLVGLDRRDDLFDGGGRKGAGCGIALLARLADAERVIGEVGNKLVRRERRDTGDSWI